MLTFILSFINWKKAFDFTPILKNANKSWLSEIGKSDPHNRMFALSKGKTAMIILKNLDSLSGLYLAKYQPTSQLQGP